jgi:hypothetical protein
MDPRDEEHGMRVEGLSDDELSALRAFPCREGGAHIHREFFSDQKAGPQIGRLSE